MFSDGNRSALSLGLNVVTTRLENNTFVDNDGYGIICSATLPPFGPNKFEYNVAGEVRFPCSWEP